MICEHCNAVMEPCFCDQYVEIDYSPDEICEVCHAVMEPCFCEED
jgi:hypothetical protein